MIIKQIHEIRLKDVIILDATKSASILIKYWFVPLWMCKKQLEKLANEIFEKLGGKQEFDLEFEFERLSALRKIQLLDALHKALIIEVNLKTKINAWRIVLQKDYKESKQLEDVLRLVKQYTGIEVNGPEDVKAVENFVEHKLDKYNEMFPKPDQAEEGRKEINLSEVIFSVFNYLNQPYNEDMRLITFVELKKTAESKINQTKTTQNGELE